MPILAFDCLFVTTGDDSKTRDEITLPKMECKLKMLVAMDIASGSLSSHVLENKGVEEHMYSVDKLVEDTE